METSTELFPLHFAARNNDKDAVEKLLDQGYSVNDRDDWNATPLMLAAGFGYCELLEFLINREADLNAKVVEGGVRIPGFDPDNVVSRCRGKTALISAVQYGFGQVKTVIDILIKSGAGVRLSDDVGWSEILEDYMSESGAFLHVVQYFVDEKIDLEDKTPEGDTILGIAARLKQIEAIDLLVISGACVHSDEYRLITVDFPQLKDRFLTDVEFCTQVVINNFNKKCLPALYSLPGVPENLPRLKNIAIKNTKSVAREIAKCVEKEIQEKTYCNVMEVQPIVLTVLSVKAFLNANIPSATTCIY